LGQVKRLDALFCLLLPAKPLPDMRLNVIVPCYNPAVGWEIALMQRFSEFNAALDGLFTEVGLLVVNDGSDQNTTQAHFKRLKQGLPQAQIISYEHNRGKGYALRKGVENTNADFYLLTDADFPYTVESMLSLVRTLIQHGGVVAGNRDTGYYETVPPFRRRLSKAFRWVIRNLLRQPIEDSQCGLKGFDKQGKGVFLQTTINRFLFDLEFLMIAREQVRVTPVPVELRAGVRFNRVGWSALIVEAANLLRLLFKHSKKHDQTK